MDARVPQCPSILLAIYDQIPNGRLERIYYRFVEKFSNFGAKGTRVRRTRFERTIIMIADRQHAFSDTSINAPTFNLLKGLLAFSLCFSHLVCLHLRVLLLAILLLSTLLRFHAATSSLLPEYHCSIQLGHILLLFFILFSTLRCMLWTILIELFGVLIA